MGSKADITDMKMHEMPVAGPSIVHGFEGKGKSLETERLYLEKADVRHLDAWYEAMIDGYEDGVKWLKWSEKVPSKDAVRENIEQWIQECASGYYRRFFIFKKEKNQLIGVIGFYKDGKPDQVQLSYYMRQSERNKGYMTEMVNAVVTWVQEKWRISKVIIRSEKNNIASVAIIRKVQ